MPDSCSYWKYGNPYHFFRNVNKATSDLKTVSQKLSNLTLKLNTLRSLRREDLIEK